MRAYPQQRRERHVRSWPFPPRVEASRKLPLSLAQSRLRSRPRSRLRSRSRPRIRLRPRIPHPRPQPCSERVPRACGRIVSAPSQAGRLRYKGLLLMTRASQKRKPPPSGGDWLPILNSNSDRCSKQLSQPRSGGGVVLSSGQNCFTLLRRRETFHPSESPLPWPQQWVGLGSRSGSRSGPCCGRRRLPRGP